jgi:hypothetical protein
LSKNNFPILLALLPVFCVAYMDVGQGREQDAEAFQQELHNAAMGAADKAANLEG